MKKFIVLLMVLQSTMLFSQEILVDKIIGVVGNQAILFSDIEQQFALLLRDNPTVPDQARCVILEQLMVQNMLVVRANLDSIEINDDQVEAQLDARIDQILAYMNGDVQQFIDYYGKTPDEVKGDFREDLKNQLLAQQMQQIVMDRVTVTPSEVVTFFKQIPADSLPYFNSEVEVGEIVIRPTPNNNQKQKAYNQLLAIKKRIEAGEDFATLAKKYSEDIGSGRMGGNLGWKGRGVFVQEFEAAAYNLDEGQLSEIIETEFGYHLIQLMGRRGNLLNTRHILIKPKIVDQDIQRAYMRLDSIRNLVMKDSISFQYAVARFSDENTQSKTNAGLLVNPQTGQALFEIGDLSPEVYFAIDTMKVGNISAPVRFDNLETGEVTFKAIYLISRTEPHVANLQDDYAKIQNAALERKKLSFMEKWVKEQKGKIYIKVEDDFATCPNIDSWQNKNLKGN